MGSAERHHDEEFKHTGQVTFSHTSGKSITELTGDSGNQLLYACKKEKRAERI